MASIVVWWLGASTAMGGADRGVATFQLTANAADVPGPGVVCADLPVNALLFFDGTPLGPGVASAREFDFMGERIPMGFRSGDRERIDNTYFPGFSTPLTFRFDGPVAAAGAFIAGVPTSGVGPAYGVFVTVYDEMGGTPFSEFVEFPEGGPAIVFVGVVSNLASIAEIEFQPDSIGGIGVFEVRPGGPAFTLCPGDTNGDRVVDFLDLNNVLSDFGLIGFGLAGDLDADGDCDFIDLNIVLSAFGSTC